MKELRRLLEQQQKFSERNNARLAVMIIHVHNSVQKNGHL